MSVPRLTVSAVKTLADVATLLGRLVGKTRVKTLTVKEHSDSARRAAPARWATMGKAATVTNTAAVPGPTVKPNQPLPCGCQVAREADGSLRLWYCRTHGAAFQLLDVLRASADVLDQVIKHPPGDLDAVRRAQAVVREALLKAKVTVP